MAGSVSLREIREWFPWHLRTLCVREAVVGGLVRPEPVGNRV